MNMKAIFEVTNTTLAVVKKKPEKNLGLYRTWTYHLAIPEQYSTNWANKPTGSWS